MKGIRCPKCGSTEVKWINPYFTPYLCLDCGEKFRPGREGRK